MYYRPTKAPPKVRADLAEPIKALIEVEPSFGYRAVAGLLAMNKNTVQRILPMAERVIRTLKEQCMHRHRFESLQHASRVIAD